MNAEKDTEAVKTGSRLETKDSGEVTQKISKVVGLQKKSGKSKGKKEEVMPGDELAGSQDKESGSKRHPDDAATVESQEVFQMVEKQEKEIVKEKQAEILDEKVDAQAKESVAVEP